MNRRGEERGEMSPLSELPASVALELEGVAFDVDDTFTTHGVLHADAFEALWSLREAGLRLFAVTGRPLGWTEVMAATWPVDLAVGENGAGWHRREGSTLRSGFFEEEPERRRQAQLIHRIRDEVAEALPDIALASDHASRRCDLAFDIGERARVEPRRAQELVNLIESQGARSTTSSIHVHAVPGSWDKASGAVHAARAALGLELDPGRWLFAGDSSNDAPGFSFFGVTVGVANVRAHLARMPHAPQYVTDGERGAGFVELARHVLRAREHGR
jgi:hypothetical protein